MAASAAGCGGGGASGGGEGDDDTDMSSADGGSHPTDSGLVHLSDGATVVVLSDGATVMVSPDGSALTPDAGCAVNGCGIGVCMSDGTCDPTATDGQQDGAETDTDCGGALNVDGTVNPSSDGAPACKDGKTCLLGNDCVDLVCSDGAVTSPSADGSPINCPSGATCTCQTPTAMDGVKNDSETDRDCGGKLGAGGVANPNSDQANGAAMLCTPGQGCAFGTDCSTGVCNGNMNAGGLPIDCPVGTTCLCQNASPTDTVQNGGETDVDCGGLNDPATDGAGPCGVGKVCIDGNDCTSKVCGTDKTCAAPSPNDSIQNGGETDVDCGGALDATGAAVATSDNAPKCADLNAKTGNAISVCVTGYDCLSGYCDTMHHQCTDGNSCSIPAPTKASQILDIVDFAGTANDATGTPDANGVSTIWPGQRSLAGIDTCGTGEATDAVQNHDSCCKSLDLDVLAEAKTIRYDKYEVTSGRMRQFIESVDALENGSGNVQAWIRAQFSTDGKYTPLTPIGTRLAKMIPTAPAASGKFQADIISLFPQTWDTSKPLNLVQQLGGTSMDDAHPSTEQGCFTTVGAGGAGTYWFDMNDGSVTNEQPRRFTQDYYDEKPQNCLPYWMAAAFCAWDGGYLPTLAEASQLWNNSVVGTNGKLTTQNYPWGATSRRWQDEVAAGTATNDDNRRNQALLISIDNNNDYGSQPVQNKTTGVITYSANTGYFYSFPPNFEGNFPDTLTDGSDFTPYISSPGRFVSDVTLATATGIWKGDHWYDFGADMFEYETVPLTSFVYSTATAGSSFCDTTDHQLATKSGTTYTCPTTNGVTYDCNQASDGGQFCGHIRSYLLPNAGWQGYSWEVHTLGAGVNGSNQPIHTQYGKAGFRCARDIEPTK